MDYSQLILGFLGLLIAFASLFKESVESDGSSWEKKYKWKNILALLYIIGFISTVIFSRLEGKDQEVKDKKTDEIHVNVDSILQGVPDQVLALEAIVSRLGSLQTQLETVECNTVDAIAEREASIKEFRKISAQLSQQSKIELFEFEENAPSVVCTSTDTKWIKKDSNSYQLKFLLKNMGNRTAYDLYLESCLIFIDTSNTPIKHYSSPMGVKKNLFPYSKRGYSQALTTAIINKAELQNRFSGAFLILDLSYYDKYFNNKIEETLTLIWEGVERDRYSFRIHNDTTKNPLIINYLEQNNLSFNLKK